MVLQGSMISFGEEGSVIRSPGAGGVGWGGGRRKEGRETYTYSLFGFYIRPGRLEDSLAIDRFYRLRVFAEQRPAPGDFSIFSGNNPLRHTGWLLTFTLHPDSDCYIFTDGLYIHRLHVLFPLSVQMCIITRGSVSSLSSLLRQWKSAEIRQSGQQGVVATLNAVVGSLRRQKRIELCCKVVSM